MSHDLQRIGKNIATLSAWIDDANSDRNNEAATWARIAKITEEAGETVAAYIGATGQNPRKGTTHTMHDVEGELIDVAVTALAALEHLRGNDGSSMEAFDAKLRATLERVDLQVSA